MIKAGIIGAAGYTGGELMRLLLNHPQAEIVFAHSKSQANAPVWSIHRDLVGETDLKFSDTLSAEADVLFLCAGHGEARKFLTATPVSESTRIIDLSQDFRLKENASLLNRSFVYGLTEWNEERIKTAQNIANPGCFATCIQLALLPLAEEQLLSQDVHISATTGSTGAGQSLSDTSHFSWRNSNLSVYKAFGHQHLAEIGQSIQALQPGFGHELNFIPARGNFTRGIFATLYTPCGLSLEEATRLYEAAYKGEPFVFVSKEPIDLKQVVNTNKCLLHLEKHGNTLLITSVIDNLLKGASGQAVQNMNLMFGLEAVTGLKLKATAF